MNKSGKIIETFANIAIILAAVSILAILGYKYFPGSAEPERLKTGTNLSIPGTDWSAGKQTLVLALQKGCHFCSESAPFYQKLIKLSQARNSTQILAVLPNSIEDSKNYFKELGLELSEIRQVNLGTIGIRGTPTIVLADEQGNVIESWVGKLNAEDEEKVLQKIFCNKNEGCS